MTTEALSTAIAVFVLGVACATALYRALFGVARMREDRLLEPSYSGGEAGAAILHGPAEVAGFGGTWLGAMANRMSDEGKPKPGQRQLVVLLSHAGFRGRSNLAIFYVIRLLAIAGGALVGLGLGALHGSLGPQLALIFGALGYFLPLRVLRRIGRNRQVRITHELPALLDLLTVCLEAGVALTEALRMIARRAERRGGVLGTDLAIMTGELGAGVSLADALHNLTDRTGTEDLKAVAALLIQSDRLGSRLGPALRAASEQLAVRRRMRAEERAQKAAVKMLFPLVILILPAMLAVILGPAFLQILAVVSK